MTPSGIDVAWSFELPSNELVISLAGPVDLLAAFDTPGALMAQFVEAVQTQGMGEMVTNSVHVTVTSGRFQATWTGVPAPGASQEWVDLVMGHVIRELA